MTNLGKMELVEEVSNVTGCSKKDVASIINALTETVTTTVAEGGKVALTGFGTFESVKRAARVGINPAKGTKIQIPERTVPRFKAGKKFKDAVSQ